MIKTLTPLLAALLTASLCLPAQAQIIPAADFHRTHNLGIGLTGFSYDAALGNFSLGGMVNGNNLGASNQTILLALRALARFYHTDNLSAGLVGGIEYDPGQPGEHANLVPDLGVALAYRFNLQNLAIAGSPVGGFPLVLRLNVTVGPTASSNYNYSVTPAPQSTDVLIRPNFFQRLGLGPNTTVALAYQANDNLEITLGGGTLLGMRLSY